MAPAPPSDIVSSLLTAIQAHQWPTVSSLGFMVLVWFLRAQAPNIETHWSKFFHTKFGALAISAIPSLFEVVAHAIAENGFHWQPLVLAAVMYVFSLLIVSNPSLIQAQVSTIDAASIAATPPGLGKVLK